MQVPCAGGGKGRPRRLYSLNPASFEQQAIALRGRRQGAATPPAPPARDFVPWIPDLMRLCAERLMCMPTGKLEQAAMNACLSTTKAGAGALIVRQALLAGGSGGALRPPAGSARGRAHSHP
jgi:hypothetical protein